MKTVVCPECGQWNGHHMGCPEMPEPVEFDEDEVADEALDELENREHERAMWWPKPHFASCGEQEDFDE